MNNTSNEENIYDRKSLYQEVWSRPMRIVASQYGISDTMLKKICKNMDIPTPPRGYWAKVNNGQKVCIPQLERTNKPDSISGFRTTKRDEGPDMDLESPIDQYDPQRKQEILKKAESLIVNETKHLHHQLRNYRDKGLSYKDPQYHLRKNDSTYKEEYGSIKPLSLERTVSVESVRRAASIINALCLAVESLQDTVTSTIEFQIGDETIALVIYELQNQVKHELTPLEIMQLKEYEDSLKNRRYAYEPRIPKYDYHYSGRLVLRLENRKSFRDSEKKKLEDQLGDVLIEIYKVAEIKRVRREKHDAEELEKAKNIERKNFAIQRYNQEVTAFQKLEADAIDFARANRIRDYVAYIESTNPQSEDSKKICSWAKDKANWLDPALRVTDQYFGQRSNESNSEKRDPDLELMLHAYRPNEFRCRWDNSY